jgi:integrase/recombinase XerD
MNPLRQQMIELMTYRNFSPRTHEVYLSHIIHLAKFYKRSPEKITSEEVQQWLKFLFLNKQLAPASVHQAYNALNFLYHQVLGREGYLSKLTLPKRAQRIPDLLTPLEVQRIIQSCPNLKYYTMLSLCYGCGLRLTEIVAVQVNHLNSKQRRIKIEQGKGKKDRVIPLSEGLLGVLRQYWHYYRSIDLLFYTKREGHMMSVSSLQKVYQAAKDKAEVAKKGGIHALRHAYATHQLDVGMPIHQLKDILGHTDIRTTMRYLHWCPKTSSEHFDLLQNWAIFEQETVKQESS